MTKLLEILTRDLTAVDLWTGLLFASLVVFGLGLLSLGLGYRLRREGWLLQLNKIDHSEQPSTRGRILLALLGLSLCAPGVFGLYRITSTTSLVVLTSLTEEEYAQFQVIEDSFRAKHKKIRLRSENVNWEVLVQRLKQNRVDIVVFDVTRRLELVRENLVQPLDSLRRYIPSSVNPNLIDHLNFDGRLYFIPYRPNVRIGWWNSRFPRPVDKCETKSFLWKPETDAGRGDAPAARAPTWSDVRDFAKCSQPESKELTDSDKRLEHYGVVLSAKGADWDATLGRGEPPPLDAALLLLEILRVSGRQAWEVCSSWEANNESSPLRILRDLYMAASPKSSGTDWQTASGHLLSGHVELARNWSHSISTMRRSGELAMFHPMVAWTREFDPETPKTNRFRTLLGGDVIGVARHARRSQSAEEVIAFLLSKEAQSTLVQGLAWPPLRYDALPDPESERPATESLFERKDQSTEVYVSLSSTRAPSGTSSQSISSKFVTALQPPDIEDSECHASDPQTKELAQNCTLLHLYQAREAVRHAILQAEPTPNFWSPEMHRAYTDAFHALVATKDLNDVAAALEKAAKVYCVEPGGSEDGRKWSKFIKLRIGGYPNRKWNDALNRPRVRVNLVRADPSALPASYHTGLCVALDTHKGTEIVRIPAGFTSGLSRPVPERFFRSMKITGARAWEMTTEDDRCASPGERPVSKTSPDSPVRIQIVPFTPFAVLFLGMLVGTFVPSSAQQTLLAWCGATVRTLIGTRKRRIRAVLVLLGGGPIAVALWLALYRLEYAPSIVKFAKSDLALYGCVTVLAMLVGFFLEMWFESRRSARSRAT